MTPDPSKVLLISYLFPPSGGVGIPRAVSYTRYLPQHGCRVWVVTARNPATPAYDPSLLAQVPPGTEVCRAFNPELSYALRDRIWKRVAPARLAAEYGTRHAASSNGSGSGSLLAPAARLLRRAIERLACPDAQVGWIPFARRAAFDLIERHGIGTVLQNIPPYSQMSIGVAIKRRFPHIKLIGDIRDDWRGYYLEKFDSAASPYKRRLAARLEEDFVRAADFISAVTPEQSAAIRDRYPGVDKSKFFCTPNGFEPASFDGFTPRPHGTGRVVITYFGSVYGNPVYSPKLYLDALDQLPEPLRSRIETRFVGRVAKEAEATLEGRRTLVRRIGFMPKSEGIRYLEETDYLLVIARDPTTHAGKLFDYLGTGKPILALTPEGGEIDKLLSATRTGHTIAAETPEGIQRAITEAVERLDRGQAGVNPDREAIRSYSWPALVEHLARFTGLGVFAAARGGR